MAFAVVCCGEHPLQRPLTHWREDVDKEGGSKATIGGGGGEMGAKMGSLTATNMIPTSWHRWHGRSDNQQDNDDGGERGRGSGRKRLRQRQQMGSQ